MSFYFFYCVIKGVSLLKGVVVFFFFFGFFNGTHTNSIIYIAHNHNEIDKKHSRRISDKLARLPPQNHFLQHKTHTRKKKIKLN